ncbi:uncharacterized protein LOC122008583 [Zingiber officinale]|uniref:uncharacterized protein LOC122008583 n=1 Tax=Zingiber officinale TaxID=94328 RepID=UPI001C4AC297|nr:uncharacterized protein LOC122008583 [Zingiber officinale]
MQKGLLLLRGFGGRRRQQRREFFSLSLTTTIAMPTTTPPSSFSSRHHRRTPSPPCDVAAAGQATTPPLFLMLCSSPGLATAPSPSPHDDCLSTSSSSQRRRRTGRSPLLPGVGHATLIGSDHRLLPLTLASPLMPPLCPLAHIATPVVNADVATSLDVVTSSPFSSPHSCQPYFSLLLTLSTMSDHDHHVPLLSFRPRCIPAIHRGSGSNPSAASQPSALIWPLSPRYRGPCYHRHDRLHSYCVPTFGLILLVCYISLIWLMCHVLGLHAVIILSWPTCQCLILVCLPILCPDLRADLMSRSACRSYVPACVPVFYPDLQLVFRFPSAFGFASPDPSLHPDQVSSTLPGHNNSSSVPFEGAPWARPRSRGTRNQGDPVTGCRLR